MTLTGESFNGSKNVSKEIRREARRPWARRLQGSQGLSRSARQAAAAALVALGVLCSSAPVAGQSITTHRIEWDYTAPLSEVSSYTHTVSVDAAPVVGAIACAAKPGVAGDVTCGVTVPALAAGAHTVSISALFGGQTSTLTVSGVDPAKGPKSPTGNPRVSRIITITIP
jgi:hypothetical protein